MSLIVYLRLLIVFGFLILMFNISIAQKDDSSDCPNIIECVFARDAARVQQFIDEGVNINSKNPTGNTLLIFVADQGDASMAAILLNAQSNLDLDIQNADGVTALMVASRRGKLDTVNLLLEAGADFTLEDGNGYTASYHAIRTLIDNFPHQHPDEIDSLLEIALNLRKKERGE